MTIEEVQANYGEGYRPFGAKQLSNMSVLKSNGFVNITPYHDKDGLLVEDSVKSCMFSIENLAWKDMEFNGQVYRGKTSDWLIREKEDGTEEYNEEILKHPWGSVLSKSQIGPNGGRIMWFPPYNIKFSENINTQWNDNSFIGRGEKIYTYVNTERSGTLSFTMLIDHPSVVDKWSKQNRSKYQDDAVEKQKYEEKILRFFAGCGTLNNELDDKTDQEKEKVEDNNKATEMSKTPVPKGDNTFTIKVPVFFPNYCTGINDYGGGISDSDFMEYMLSGTGVYETEGHIGYEMTNSGTTLVHPLKNTTSGQPD